MCNAQYSDALDMCLLHSLQRHVVCVVQSLERDSVCTAQSRKTLCVYCTVQSGTVWVLHILERHCECTAQYRGALCVCVLHSVERHCVCVCTAQCREALFVCVLHGLEWHFFYWTVQIRTASLLEIIERHSQCTALSRAALYLNYTVQKGTICVLYILDWLCVCAAQYRHLRVCTAQSRVVLCVYCTLQSGTLCVLHTLEWYSVCTAQSGLCHCRLYSTHTHRVRPYQQKEQNHSCNFSQAIYRAP